MASVRSMADKTKDRMRRLTESLRWRALILVAVVATLLFLFIRKMPGQLGVVRQVSRGVATPLENLWL